MQAGEVEMSRQMVGALVDVLVGVVGALVVLWWQRLQNRQLRCLEL